MSLFSWLGNPLGFLPPERRRSVLLWTLHVVLVVLIVLGLGYLNLFTQLQNVLRTRFLGLQYVWLPLLFLLGYLLFWLIRGIYGLLGPDGPAGEFDDIEQAWVTAKQQLQVAGLDLSRLPIFLVLGKPASPIEQVFGAARMSFQVSQVPAHPDAPIHVHATREAIFVSCEGASLLPVLTNRLLDAAPTVSGSPADLTNLLAQNSLQESPATEEGGAESALKRAPAVLLLGEPEPSPDAPRRSRRTSLMKDADIVDLQKRRLRHVCRLLFRDRQPYCPANGIIVLLPLKATATAEDVSEASAVAQQDLQVARSALQLDCPRLMVLCDCEQLPGFGTLVQYFPEGQGKGERFWVIGQHFPLRPDVLPREFPDLIDKGLSWVSDSMLPLVIGKLWMREGEGNVTDRGIAVETNIQLYEFLNSTRQSLKQLARLSARAVTEENSSAPPMLGGCYMAGTGADGLYGQGFLTGVLRRAMELQNHVRWTDEALADNNAYRNYSWLGYVLLTVFVVAVSILMWSWW